MVASSVDRSQHQRPHLSFSRDPEAAPLRTLAARLVPVLPALAAVAFLPGGLDQFWLPKVLVLLVGLPLVVAVSLVWGEPTLPAGRGGRLLALALAATLVSTVAPLATARNLGLHLLGAAESWLLFGLFLAAAATVRPQDLRTAAPLALPTGAAVLVAGMAVLQGVGLDPMRWIFSLQSSRPGRWRILATTGNPGWTAELLAAAFPLAVAWAWSGILRRRLLPGLALLLTTAVALTGSRTGLLALAAGAAVLVLAGAGGDRWRRRVGAGAAAAAVVGCGAILALAAGSARWGELRPLTGRAALWSAGARLIARHPLLGSGLRHTGLLLPDGLRGVVDAVKPGAASWLPTTLVDRLDGDWLQLALEGGLPAAAALLGVWVLALALAWRRARRDGSALHAGIAGSLAAMGVSTLVSAPLHTPSTAFLFWYLAGLSAGGAPGGSRSLPRGSSTVRRVAEAAAVAGIAAAVVLAGLALSLDLAAGRGRRLSRSGRAARAVAPLKRAVRVLPWLEGGAPELADALLRSGEPEEALAACVESARWRASERVWAAQARALARLGEPAAARTVLAAGFEVLPRSPLLLAAWYELFPGVPDPAGASLRDPAMVRP